MFCFHDPNRPVCLTEFRRQAHILASQIKPSSHINRQPASVASSGARLTGGPGAMVNELKADTTTPYPKRLQFFMFVKF
jgi:hypothetical protein